MNKNLDRYNNLSNIGKQVEQKNEYKNPNIFQDYFPPLPIKTKNIKKFFNDPKNIEDIQNRNLNSNRFSFVKKENIEHKNYADESLNENNNIGKLILYEIRKNNQHLWKVYEMLNENINKSSNKHDEKFNLLLKTKRERENEEYKSKKYKEENKNNISGNIYIKKEKYCSKNVDDALEQYVNNLNSNDNYIKSTLFTETQSLNLNSNEIEKANLNTYNLNCDLSKYFEIDNESKLLYGCPLNSSITITNDNKIYYPEGNDSKIYIIIGKEEIRFDNNFKYQFKINKKGQRGITIGFLNINEAINHEFGPLKCKNCGFLVSSGKKIYNYLFKDQKGIKCNEIKDNSNIIFEYKINNNYIELFINEFTTKINLDFRQIGGNNEFRIAIFISKNCFVQVEKIK